MYGSSNMGALEVLTSTGQSPVWQKSGNNGNKWEPAEVDISASNTAFSVRFSQIFIIYSKVHFYARFFEDRAYCNAHVGRSV